MTDTEKPMLVDDKPNFSREFQEKLLKLCLTDLTVSISCFKYIEPNFFDGDILAIIYKTMKNYYIKYNKAITGEALTHELKEYAKTNKQHTIFELLTMAGVLYKIKVEEPEYIKDKLEEFIKRSIFVPAFTSVGRAYNKGAKFEDIVKNTRVMLEDIDKVKFAPADQTFFFDDLSDRYAKRLDAMANTKVQRIRSFVFELDTITRGGLCKGEFGLVTGNAKSGKSIYLLNVAAKNAKAGNKVIYCNLEGPLRQLENRMEACILNMDYYEVVKNEIPSSAFDFYKTCAGNLVLHNFTSFEATITDIEAVLKDLKVKRNFEPDLVCIDYGDLLTPRVGAFADKYSAQESCYRDMKRLAEKYNCVVWSASQTNRMKDHDTNNPAFVISRKNLADSYSKVRICDLHITINMTDVEYKNKLGRLYLDAYRDSEMNQVIPYKNDYSKMQFYVPTMAAWDKGV